MPHELRNYDDHPSSILDLGMDSSGRGDPSKGTMNQDTNSFWFARSFLKKYDAGSLEIYEDLLKPALQWY